MQEKTDTVKKGQGAGGQDVSLRFDMTSTFLDSGLRRNDEGVNVDCRSN
jgi:hypothetical protein